MGFLAISRRCSLSRRAIVKNDQDAIRAAAKALPNLQTPGPYGNDVALLRRKRKSWQRPELAEAVRTLLSLGRGPKLHQRQARLLRYGQRGACVGAHSPRDVGGGWKSETLAMSFGEPMISQELVFGLLPGSGKVRDLIYSSTTAPISIPRCRRVSRILPVIRLLLYRTKMGLDDKLAYADALALLERAAAIRNRVAADGMTFGKMLNGTSDAFSDERSNRPPTEFTALWDWAQKTRDRPASAVRNRADAVDSFSRCERENRMLTLVPKCWCWWMNRTSARTRDAAFPDLREGSRSVKETISE